MDFLAIGLLSSLTCGVISAAIASNKGRSGIGWFFIGALFGPLAVICALIVGGNSATLEHQALQQGLTKKCPFCAEMVKSEAIVCRFCNREFPKQEQPEGNQSLDTQFDHWLTTQNPPLINLSENEQADYRRAFEYRLKQGEL